MIPDGFQYFFDDFWNFQNFVKIWTRNPPNYCQFTLKNTRKILDHPWKTWILDIWESENLKISGSPVYLTSSFVLFFVFIFVNLWLVVCFCFFVFFLVFLMYQLGFWGFNYSKMANYRFLIDSTTFWMISGTSIFCQNLEP